MSRGRLGAPYRFPILRDTAGWERQERIKRAALIIGFVVLVVIGFAIGGCNGAHGRC